MSTPTTDPLDPSEAPARAPLLTTTRPFYWSVRRELWENRSLYLGPLSAAGVVLFGFVLSLFTLPHRMRGISALEAGQQGNKLAAPFGMAAMLIMFTTLMVAVFYCLEALHAERRDRSILFWKSLPVSDLTTVLSKAVIPLVVLPAVAFVVALATQLVMLFVSTVVLFIRPGWAAMLWERLPLARMAVVMFYGLTVHALWHAPLYAWLLMVSAWARRTLYLWAILPPLALCILEKLAFGSTTFAKYLGYRVVGAMKVAFTPPTQRGVVIDRFSQLDPLGFLGSAGLWSGLALAALFLAAAVRLRRNREPL